MRTIGIWAAATVGLYVIQSSLLPLLAYHGLSANLLLLWVVSFAFLKGHRFGVFMGFCAGLLQDLATGTFFGCNTLIYMTAAFVCGKLSNRVFKEDFFLPILFSVFVTAGYYFMFAMFMFLLGYRFQLAALTQYILVPMLFYQLALAYPIHRLAYGLDGYLQKKK